MIVNGTSNAFSAVSIAAFDAKWARRETAPPESWSGSGTACQRPPSPSAPTRGQSGRPYLARPVHASVFGPAFAPRGRCNGYQNRDLRLQDFLADIFTSMSDVTRILSAIEQGDPHAAEKLLPLVEEVPLKIFVGQILYCPPRSYLPDDRSLSRSPAALLPPRNVGSM